MNKYYVVNAIFINKQYEVKDLQDAVILINQIFNLEYESENQLPEKAQDVLYEMKVTEINVKTIGQKTQPTITIKPSNYRKWTGKDIPKIKERNDFLKLFAFVEDAFTLAKKSPKLYNDLSAEL
jgi:hypothetical protein